MSIIKVGEIFEYKFGENAAEHKVDIALGGLPVNFSTLRAKREITTDDKYKLELGLTADNYDEIKKALLPVLVALNEADSLGATEKKLEELLTRSLNESQNEPGTYRFVGSKKMGRRDRETGTLIANYMGVYDADGAAIEGGVMLGKGSVVRSVFQLCLFKHREKKQVMLRIDPVKVFILKKVDPPQREQRQPVNFDGVSDAYDY